MRWKALVGFVSVAAVIAGACEMVEMSGDDNGRDQATDTQDPCDGVPTVGTCKDDTTILTCLHVDSFEEDVSAKVVEQQCHPGRACREKDGGGAHCVVIGECTENDTQCSADHASVRTCKGTGENTHWETTTCNVDAGEKCTHSGADAPATCMYVPSQSGSTGTVTFRGLIKYEYRDVRSDHRGWGDIDTQVIKDLYVTVYEGSEFLGAAMSGYDSVAPGFTEDGSFVGVLARAPGPNAVVYAWPLIWDYDTATPMMAMVKATSPDPMESARNATEYWSYAKPLPAGTTDIGTWTIKESEGSGALHIFQWIDYGLLRGSLGIPNKKQYSLAVMWNPSIDRPTCGNCMCGTNCGGAKVKFGDGAADVDYYDMWIALGGPSNKGSTQWARSVISHEFGHYMMCTYSRDPGEAGVHYVDQISKPGLAYNEGWATAFGQSHIRDSFYVDEQNGTFFWVNIANYTYNNHSLAMPTPNGGIDQNINENVVAGMIWKLFVNTSYDPQGRGLGDNKVFGALTFPKLVNGEYNRGYKTVDTVDFFDAAICSGNAGVADINAVSQTSGFPYNASGRPCN